VGTTTLGSPRTRALLGSFAPAMVIVVLSLILFPVPAGVAVQGLILGLLGAMIAVGMALIYRANRILNFAQGELGTAPTVLVVCLVVYAGWNYFLALSVGIVGAVLLGALVELAVIRRFFRSPRLILTVATLGLAQLLSLGAIFIPLIWGKRPATNQIHFPVNFYFTIEPIRFSSDYVVALVVAPLALVGVALLLRFTSIGVAIRASAESADRASLLGVPVKRLQTVVWALAGLLSFLGVFLQAGIQGLPVITTLNLSVLLASLAALTLGNLTDLPAVAVSAVALGLLQEGITWKYKTNPEMVEPILALVIVVCLLVRKVGATRADQDRSSSWNVSDEVRPVPHELRSLPEVRAVRWGGAALVGIVALALPWWLGVGDQLKATAAVVFVIITMSVVVLTGWAGQVSLGQMSFAAFGAAVGAYATQHWNLDLSLTLLLAGVVGAAVALVVGLPALRLRGFFLAVTTLAFAMATSAYLLNVEHFSWVPDPNTVVDRPHLFGGINLDSQRTYYYVCLAVLGLAVLAVRGIRRSRTGRVLLALRENERGAQAFGINVLRAKLTAFAISGFLAAVGGCLLVHLLGGFSPDTYAPDQSFVVFIAAVVGGLGSLLGAALGSLYLKGAQWWLPGAQWQTLASSAGVLLVLMIIPGGVGDLVYKGRDAALRWVADRRGIIVPSLVADSRRPDEVSGPEAASELLAVQAADDIVAVDLDPEPQPDPAGATGSSASESSASESRATGIRP
jgi:branched-chain amino acid transport system permease protein